MVGAVIGSSDASLGSGVIRGRTAPGDTIQGVTPSESLNIFFGWIYKNTGQTITWIGGEGGSGDDG